MVFLLCVSPKLSINKKNRGNSFGVPLILGGFNTIRDCFLCQPSVLKRADLRSVDVLRYSRLLEPMNCFEEHMAFKPKLNFQIDR